MLYNVEIYVSPIYYQLLRHVIKWSVNIARIKGQPASHPVTLLQCPVLCAGNSPKNGLLRTNTQYDRNDTQVIIFYFGV